MPSTLQSLIARARAAEAEIETEIERRRAALGGRLERGRLIFSEEVLARHRAVRQSLLVYLRGIRPRDLIAALITYSLILPIALADLWVSFYQWSCFPIFGIPRVRRRDFIVTDRHHLAYLNVLEKLNCLYCGYANGVIAYGREVASRTEAYWCPIKHAKRWPGGHGRYVGFMDYGDHEDFIERWAESRRRLREEPSDES